MGMGKSTAAEVVAKLGIPVIDTDQIAREIVAPGQPAGEEIRAAFGSEVFHEDGVLNRAVLAELVFRDPVAREKLEAITHPRIRQRWRSLVQDWQRRGEKLVVVVIPLLFETRAEQELDATICVACSAATQQARLTCRHWTAEQTQRRIQAQLPADKKMILADFVVWNEGPSDGLKPQLERIIGTILGRSPSGSNRAGSD
jgi:dephospho-CoA kinase